MRKKEEKERKWTSVRKPEVKKKKLIKGGKKKIGRKNRKEARE